MQLRIETVRAPIGDVLLVTNGRAVCALDFAHRRAQIVSGLAARYGDVTFVRATAPSPFARRVRAYFAGDVAALRRLPVETGGTAFQRRVWSALRRIPPGRTSTYGAIAAAIGRPGAARAVGAANARNPVALAVPCHRVIGADGTLTGYAGGVERKRWLLDHERRRRPSGV